jgi:hypothetical protein
MQAQALKWHHISNSVTRQLIRSLHDDHDRAPHYCTATQANDFATQVGSCSPISVWLEFEQGRAVTANIGAPYCI